MSHSLVINGWNIHAHPLFVDQLDDLIEEVDLLRERACKQGNPEGYLKKNSSKRLAAIKKLALEVIPGNPTYTGFWQGLTLGPEHGHWRRAKFFQQLQTVFPLLPLPPGQQGNRSGLGQ